MDCVTSRAHPPALARSRAWTAVPGPRRRTAGSLRAVTAALALLCTVMFLPGLALAQVLEASQVLPVVASTGTWRFQDNGRDGATLTLLDSHGSRMGALYLMPRGVMGGDVPRVATRHYAIRLGNFTQQPDVTESLVRAAGLVAAWDGGALPDRAVHTMRSPLEAFYRPAWLLVFLAVLMGIWRRGKVSLDLRGPHVVQLLTQASIFLYWSLYWPGVQGQIPFIALMLLMGFAADAVFAFARFGSWRVGLSPLPVIFSINLFEWFDVNGAVLSIVAAFACKTLIQRNGRHVFNPSVAGLTVTGLVSLVAPGWVHFGGVFHTLSVPPNMGEWVLLVALWPQTRYRILPVSIGAALALVAGGTPSVLRPTIILAMCLLVTDPATTPRTDLGKLLFGLMFGLSLPVISGALLSSGRPDDFAKVMAVTVGNLLAPQLDWVAARLVTVAAGFRDRALAWGSARSDAARTVLARVSGPLRRPLPNLVFVALWLLFIVPRLAEEKPHDFEAEMHWNWGTPLVVRGADDVPRCSNNPTFCGVFTFPQEVSLWLRRTREQRTVATRRANGQAIPDTTVAGR